MPKQPIQEMFTGGLVTSRPPHMLSAGELVSASNTVYRPNNPAIQRAPEHGLLSQFNLVTNTGGGSGPSTGIVMGNFDGEANPIQLIARSGRDLFSYSIAGASGNVVEAISSPGKITGTFAAASTVGSCVFTNGSATINAPTTGAFDNYAVIGRPVKSTTACPSSSITGGTEYIIKTINSSGGHVTSIVLNKPAVASVTETLTFGPAFTIDSTRPEVFYNSSVGFNAQNYITITTSGSPAYTSKAPVRCQITAVTGTANGVDILTYKSCYLAYIPSDPTSHDETFIFDGGLGRSILPSEFSNFNGLSWDGSTFVCDSNGTVYRIEYKTRTSFSTTVVLLPSPVICPAGLEPVTQDFSVAEFSGESWNANFADNKTYYFIITEAYIPVVNTSDPANQPLLSNNLRESAYLGRYQGTVVSTNNPVGMPIPCKLTTTNNHHIRITTPAPANDGTGGRFASHWVVYMSAPKDDTKTRPQLNEMRRVAIAPITDYTKGQVIKLSDARVITGLLRPWDRKPVNDNDEFWMETCDPPAQDTNIGRIPPSYPYSMTAAVNNPAHHLFGYDGGDSGVRETFAWYQTNPGGYGLRAVNDFYFKEVYETSPPTSTNLGASVTTTGLKIYGIEVHMGALCGHGYMLLRPTYDDEGEVSGYVEEYSAKDESPYCKVGLQFLVGGQVGTEYIAKIGDKQTGNRWRPPLHAYPAIGPFELWGIDFSSVSPAELADTRLRVSIKYGVCDITDLAIKIYWTGTSINLDGPTYRTLTYTSEILGQSVCDPGNTPPPAGSIATVFQGSLVTNDVKNPTMIRYSMPNLPESFPESYKIRLGTKRKGKITSLTFYRDSLIVGMENCIKKITSLPKDYDGDFARKTEQVISELTSTHGIVGPSAVEVFDVPGVGQIMAYVSTIGLRYCTGTDTRALNTDINLYEYIHEDHWDKCILKAFPVQKWLVLYYVPKGSTNTVRSQSFVFSYSEDHIKSGAQIALTGNLPLSGLLPATGPNDCYVYDATELTIDSSPSIVTTDGRFVYVEDSNFDPAVVQTITALDDETPTIRVNAPVIKTRDIFPAGFTADSNIGSLYLIHDTKGTLYTMPNGSSNAGADSISFLSAPVGWTPVVGMRLIHGGWDNVVTILDIPSETSFTVSAPAVRSFTGEGTFDTGNTMIRVSAGMFGEDTVPILTEYRSTSVGVGQALMLDATANRFSVEISKVENPNTGVLTDIGEEMSIIGLVYHAASVGETSLHTY